MRKNLIGIPTWRRGMIRDSPVWPPLSVRDCPCKTALHNEKGALKYRSIMPNGGNMKSWAFWNTNLSICYAVDLMLKCSCLLLSAQFFILRVTLRIYFIFLLFKSLAE